MVGGWAGGRRGPRGQHLWHSKTGPQSVEPATLGHSASLERPPPNSLPSHLMPMPKSVMLAPGAASSVSTHLAVTVALMLSRVLAGSQGLVRETRSVVVLPLLQLMLPLASGAVHPSSICTHAGG